MFRRWLSGFWRDYKEKIMQIAKVFGILIAIGASAGVFFNIFSPDDRNKGNTILNVYNPEKTVISGSDISKEEYEEENNLAQTFIDYCNEKKIKEAYNLLTEECKEKNYPNIENFKERYYDLVFQKERIYSLQSWVSEDGYNTYKISYTGDFMATGNYSQTDKFEDYITVVTDEKGNKKLNINNYIKTEELNKKTKTNSFEIEALSCDTYMNYVEYTIRIKNLTDKEVLLDDLNRDGIKLIGTNGASYKNDTINLKTIHLQIDEGQQINITLRFKKQYGSGVTGNSIQFNNVITDYSKYLEDKYNYNGYEKVTIKL